MLQGIILCILTGLIWAVSGANTSRMARSGSDPVAFSAISSLFSTLWAWLFVADWDKLINQSIPRLGDLLIVMPLTSVFASAYSILMLYAMKKGHTGISWTIGQSAMVVPFILSIVIWNDKVTATGIAGIAFILVTLILLGSSRSAQTTQKTELIWYPIILLTFISISLQQLFSMIPSHWEGWTDVANLRIPLSATTSFAIQIILMLAMKKRPDRRIVLNALFQSVLGITGSKIFYTSMDLIAPTGYLPIVYPLAVSICILGVTLYSMFIIKEYFGKREVLGVVTGLAGIILISLR